MLFAARPLFLRTTLLLCSALALPACAGKTPPAATTYAQLEAAIGGARCQQDSDCRTVAVGARACGGPAAYLPWSQREGDAARIAALSEQHQREARAAVSASGMASICSLVSDPGARCEAQRCVLRKAGGAQESVY